MNLTALRRDVSRRRKWIPLETALLGNLCQNRKCVRPQRKQFRLKSSFSLVHTVFPREDRMSMLFASACFRNSEQPCGRRHQNYTVSGRLATKKTVLNSVKQSFSKAQTFAFCSGWLGPTKGRRSAHRTTHCEPHQPDPTCDLPNLFLLVRSQFPTDVAI